MSLVTQVLDSSGVVIPHVFKKVNTPGDKFRYQVNIPGNRKVMASGATGTVTFDLGNSFQYQVGKRQLNVFVVNVTTGVCDKLLEVLDFTGFTPTSYYEEVDSKTVKVYGVTGVASRYLFEIPHTASPGTLTSKVVVTAQGDKVVLQSLGNGDKIELRSPNGTVCRIGVDDNKNLGIEEV